jgi:outer membrane protein assembly factor BamB
MKLLYFLVILIFLQNCSFDNKTGIWKNENSVQIKEDSVFNEFKELKTSNKSFDKIVLLNKEFKFKLPKPVTNYEWKDIFYNQTNNLRNFKYNDLNQIIFRSKKLTKYEINSFIMLEDNNLIINDQRGNIIIFSINENKIITKFNFYKKRHKQIKKYLNIIVDNNILYISDNIGYLYSFDYKENKILWAKNYKIPFRSNLKINKNYLIASNDNNNLLFYNKDNGEIIKSIPTEETIVKNQFINNLSSNNNQLFFLNTYGSLYSVKTDTLKINWFLNINQTLDLNPSNIFFGSKIVNNKDKIVVSSAQFTYVINSKTGSVILKKNFVPVVKPILIDEYLFLITKNNLLIAMDLSSGKVIYSYDMNQKISEYLNIKKKKVKFKNISILNNKIFIFLENSFVIKLNINGNLEEIYKLPVKIHSNPIFIDNSILYLDTKNKLSVVN